MKLLSIGTDRKVFEKESAVRARALGYANLFNETHSILFSTKAHQKENPNIYQQGIENNLYLYPTNSKNRWHYVFNAIKIGKKIIRNWKLDIRNSTDIVISCQDVFETGFVGLWLSLRYKIKLHVQIHTDIFSQYFVSGHLLNILRVFISGIVIPRANKIRVVSKKTKEEIIKRFKIDENKITVLPVLVDKEKIQDSKIDTDLHKKYPQFDFIFLLVSRLEKEKNIPTAIEAFKKVTKEKKGGLASPKPLAKAGLVIVGEGNWKRVLEKISNENIIFEPWNENIYSYYKTADALVSTSLYEGYGMVFIESALCGCPIISSNVGIIRDEFTNEKDAMICDSRDKSCFSMAMTKLIENPDLRKKLAQNALETLERGDITLDKQKYLQKYKEQFDI